MSFSPRPFRRHAADRGASRGGVAGTLMLGLLLAGCEMFFDPTICHTGIFYETDPERITLQVGQQVTPVLLVDTCPEGRRPVDGTVWESEDPSVAAVSGATITGVAPGEVRVAGTTAEGHALAWIDVRVESAAGAAASLPVQAAPSD